MGLTCVRVGFTPTGPLAEGLTFPFSHLPQLAGWNEGALPGGAEAARLGSHGCEARPSHARLLREEAGLLVALERDSPGPGLASV